MLRRRLSNGFNHRGHGEHRDGKREVGLSS
jgi:hypothetical protein